MDADQTVVNPGLPSWEVGQRSTFCREKEQSCSALGCLVQGCRSGIEMDVEDEPLFLQQKDIPAARPG